ncbi:response regulator [Pelolinea submarina]|uniref:LuxR family two component transcriptional regulator n=1 Tax=Pelolinea submarina TaxID=913107 RepID=A0A347ZPQ0_9CHLR|nr:response regulator transcription factor [Pelolinea submarina]REG04704.1 LuxR family two component transcriptional regulator [Pelolinea submarina]BBB47281.1 two-component system response regulator [Pelolinea submarina]
MIKLIICDDQEVVCQGLKAILSTSENIQVIGIANNGIEALELLQKHPMDVVLMDLKMPIMNGIHATKAIKEKYPEIKVLVLTTYDADAWLFDAIRNGADGYLLKDTSREALVQAIEEIVVGNTPVDSKVAGKLFKQLSKQAMPGDSTLGENLSDREKEILKLIAQGMANAEIAQNLFLSEGTVRNYVSAILEKLNVDDRTQAAVLALRYGLVE